MLKAYDVMTQKVATCTPETSVTQVASIMRDRDIGDVLVVEDGKLRGIVTDRDLALRGLTGEEDPMLIPIKKLMSSRVVTGEADWSLEHVAKVLAEHQIRRLPIVQDGRLIGIISLGDVALHEGQKEVITSSLQAISTPTGISLKHRSGVRRALMGLTVGAVATSMLALFTWNRSGKELRKQITKSELVHTARQVVSTARGKVGAVGTSRTMRELRHTMRTIPRMSAVRLPFGSSK